MANCVGDDMDDDPTTCLKGPVINHGGGGWGVKPPVPPLSMLQDTHQRSKNHGERGLKMMVPHVGDFKKKGVFSGKIFAKIRKRGYFGGTGSCLFGHREE